MLQYYIYGALIIVLAVIVYGAILRKKLYREVDKLETWKIQIMNKPVTDEIAKIKGLNMSGETEKKFEYWRNEWDEILTLKLPDIEESLFDIEEAANKYRFKKAKQFVTDITNELNEIEVSIQKMFDEIDLLINSEEDNRQQIDNVRQQFKDVAKYFSQNKNLLGPTIQVFEVKLEEINDSFAAFEEATKEGNYFEAREILQVMKENILLEKKKMDEVPKLIYQIESEIPTQLKELQQGMEEMGENGFELSFFPFENNLGVMKGELNKLLQLLEVGDLTPVQSSIQELLQQIEQIYDTLEQEALARQYVSTELPVLQTELRFMQESFLQLTANVEAIKLSYHIPEEERKLHLQLEKQLKELVNKQDVIEDILTNNKQSNISLRELLLNYKEELRGRQKTLETCNDMLNSLRSDELKAKEVLKELKGKIRQGQQLIKRSNIPGLPEVILNDLKEAETSLVIAASNLEQVPLMIEDINNLVEKAFTLVNNVYDRICETIDQADAAERIIQYGNRFRSNYQDIHIELVRSEEAFRLYQYDEAFEIAYTAIEKIDPQALENINAYAMEKQV